MKAIMKKNWLFALIVIQPILDIIAYFQYDSKIGTMAGYIRLVFMCIIVCYAWLKNIKNITYYVLVGIVGVYCLLHIINGFRVGYLNLIEDVSYMAKVVQMPLLGISFCFLFKDSFYKNQVIKGMVVNFCTIVISMILAQLTHTGVYTYDIYKIGYSGWFANANSQSIIIVIIIPFVLYFVSEKFNTFSTIIVAICSTIVLLANGTKAAYLSVVIILGGYAFFYIVEYILKRKIEKEKTSYKNIIIAISYIGIVIISILSYPLTPRYAMDMLSQGRRNEESAKIEEKKKHLISDEQEDFNLEEFLADPENRQELVEIYKEDLNKRLVRRFGAETVLAEYGWMPDSHTLADVRLQKRIYAKLLWEESDFQTKMFGMEFTNMADGDLENDYAAIYYYYGYVGFGLYALFLAFFILMIFIAMIKDWKGSFGIFNFTLALTYVLQLGLAQFSGAILRRPNASVYMSIIIALIFFQCTNIFKSKLKK